MTTPSPRASARGFPNLPPIFDYSDRTETLRAIYEAVQLHTKGKFNVVGEVTLAANSTTTDVTDDRAGNESFFGFMPKTANAAAEIGAGSMFVSSQGKQTFQISHANNAQIDRTFTFVLLG